YAPPDTVIIATGPRVGWLGRRSPPERSRTPEACPDIGESYQGDRPRLKIKTRARPGQGPPRAALAAGTPRPLLVTSWDRGVLEELAFSSTRKRPLPGRSPRTRTR